MHRFTHKHINRIKCTLLWCDLSNRFFPLIVSHSNKKKVTFDVHLQLHIFKVYLWNRSATVKLNTIENSSINFFFFVWSVSCIKLVHTTHKRETRTWVFGMLHFGISCWILWQRINASIKQNELIRRWIEWALFKFNDVSVFEGFFV